MFGGITFHLVYLEITVNRSENRNFLIKCFNNEIYEHLHLLKLVFSELSFSEFENREIDEYLISDQAGPSNMGRSISVVKTAPLHRQLQRSNAMINVNDKSSIILSHREENSLNMRPLNTDPSVAGTSNAISDLWFEESCSNESLLMDLRHGCTSEEYIHMSQILIKPDYKIPDDSD